MYNWEIMQSLVLFITNRDGITDTDDLRNVLINTLHTGRPLPEIYTADKLGDYERNFEDFVTETDIKTKVLFLSGNPKGYNIDKLLSFLATERRVYLIYVRTCIKC